MSKSTTKEKKSAKETPLMKQYYAIKGKYPDALLLFRVGDFYETFGEDAVKTAGILGIVLTKRHNGSANEVELAGFPHHALDTYLPKLVKAGQRVAICDQLEAPSKQKKIVKRGVTELVTPGVSYNDEVLEHKSNNFLCAIHFGKKQHGISFLDVSTGEYFLAEGTLEYLNKLVQGFAPTEVLIQKQHKKLFEAHFSGNLYHYCLEDWVYKEDFARELLVRHFNTKSLKGFGIEEKTEGIIAAGAALHYLSATEHHKTAHINAIQRIELDQYVWLDRFTIRNLELLYPTSEGGSSLLDVMDQTRSPMGARLLKRWIVLPLKDIKLIQQRVQTLDDLLANKEMHALIEDSLSRMGDLERLISKVAVGRVNPRELLQLRNTLDEVEHIQKACKKVKGKGLRILVDQLNSCDEVRKRIETEIDPEAPVLLHKGGVINEGVNKELDELRSLANSGKEHLAKIVEREIKATGIPSLKIAFNNVFGYYIEVRNTHKDKVPEEWVRKQTLVNAERYITQELKEYESKILGAEDRIGELEQEIYIKLVSEIGASIEPIQVNASVLARLDCLQSFATVSKKYGYTKPELLEGDTIDIEEGRHPVIELQLAADEAYIANDVLLDSASQQIMMITGPNMSGKSALLRQTALICLMAQMGSHVPAKKASIGVVDKVFTRVGASDNISQGESTFMVEMNETASILNNLSGNSLILLDEIGRGTSTYDGISIAWSIAEYLHEHPKFKAKTLFATHYHELNEMAQRFERIKNYNVSVRELKDQVIFMRKLVPGGSEHSFGIHVARMAGMPSILISRANEILKQLEATRGESETASIETEDPMQLSFFQLDDPVLQQIKEELVKLDINTLTPVEALMKLNEIKRLVGG